MKSFASIGSRDTPVDVLLKAKRYTAYFCGPKYGLIMQSGGANGFDSAAEAGCDEVQGNKEVYLPFKGFNKNKSLLFHVSDAALIMAAEYHPAWDRCDHRARLLMGRNCYQVLGESLNDPVDFILCYSPGGFVSGGTSQALRIARDYKIDIYNLYDSEGREKLATFAPV